jgi:flagellar basal body-associated protein FliL
MVFRHQCPLLVHPRERWDIKKMKKIFIFIVIFIVILFGALVYYIFFSWNSVGTQMIKQDVETINNAKQIEKNVLDLKKKSESLLNQGDSLMGK